MYDIARGVWDARCFPSDAGCSAGVHGEAHPDKPAHGRQRLLPRREGGRLPAGLLRRVPVPHTEQLRAHGAIYAVVGLAIDRTMSLFGSGGAIDLTAVSVVTEDDDVPALIALLLVSVISWVVVLGAYIVALVVCWARAIQLYIMAAFSPIPLSLMALDDTRQIGIGYLKNFTAVCLAADHPDSAHSLTAHLGRPHRGEHLDGNPHRPASRRGSPTRSSTWRCACF